MPSEMVLIGEGTFTMGSTDQEVRWAAKRFVSESLEWYREETPARRIYLGDFYIDRYEVTVDQFRKYLNAVGKEELPMMKHPNFNQGNHPITGMTWHEASEYCRWQNKRLATEEEWEKAARGTEAFLYPWGNDPDATRANSRGKGDPFRYSAPVGQFLDGQSPYGVMDMAGNVWEWTGDWFKPYPGNHHANDLYGEKMKVIRGGSWISNMDLARSAVRGKALPDQMLNYIGFRCVRSISH